MVRPAIPKQTQLEDLVPPLELCKQIPHGCFQLTAMCWRTFNKGRRDQYTIVFPTGTLDPWDDDVPAPTVAEIMAESPDCRLKHKSDIFFFEHKNKTKAYAGGYNAAELALQVWLKMKGIKNEQRKNASVE